MKLTIEIDFDHEVATDEPLGTAIYLLEKCLKHLRDDDCDHFECKMHAGKNGPLVATMHLCPEEEEEGAA